jgi:hypothetical protein
MDATSPPNQISYEAICLYAGRLYLESRCEIDRLTAILHEMQQKYNQSQKYIGELQTELGVLNERLVQLQSIKG